MGRIGDEVGLRKLSVGKKSNGEVFELISRDGTGIRKSTNRETKCTYPQKPQHRQ